MKTAISISEARKHLPGLIKTLKSSPDTVYQITVHNEVVAEIIPFTKIKPGKAAARLLSVRKKQPAVKKGYKRDISGNIKEHLYVAEDGN